MIDYPDRATGMVGVVKVFRVLDVCVCGGVPTNKSSKQHETIRCLADEGTYSKAAQVLHTAPSKTEWRNKGLNK